VVIIREYLSFLDKIVNNFTPSLCRTQVIIRGTKGAVFLELTQHIAEKLVIKNLEKKTEKFRDNFIFRRVDALARIFEGDNVCCAVTYTKEQGFIYSFNFPQSKDLSTEYQSFINNTIEHFYQISIQENYLERKQKMFELIKTSVQLSASQAGYNYAKVIEEIIEAIGKTEDFPTISQLKLDNYGSLITKDAKILLQRFDLDYKTLYDKFALLNNTRNQIELINKFNDIITKTLRRYYDYKKIEQSISGIDKQFSDDIIQAFKEKKFVLIDKNNEHGNDVHAEMRILDYLYFGDRKENNNIPYIGISKLCCCHCKWVIDSLTTTDVNEEIVRGNHGKPFPWEIPLFLKDQTNFEKVFAVDQKLLKFVEELGLDNILETIRVIDHFYSNLSST